MSQWTSKSIEYLQKTIVRYKNDASKRCNLNETRSSPNFVETHIKKNSAVKPTSGTQFGSRFTDHMLTLSWSNKKGWGVPQIVPFAPLNIQPASTVLQYAQVAFEGMKAVRGVDDRVRIFRPRHNVARMQASAIRLCLPPVPEDLFLLSLKQLLLLEKDWVPHERGSSLYIRPTLIGTQSLLSIEPSATALFYIILSPVTKYIQTSSDGITIYFSTEFDSSFPSGTSNNKISANYAGLFLTKQLAYVHGCQLSGSLHGKDENIIEGATTNIFIVVQREKNGPKYLITHPLDGLVLPGVTRASVLEHEPFKLKIAEEPIPMRRMLEYLHNNQLLEMFVTGTAAGVVPVKGFLYRNSRFSVPCDPVFGIGATIKRQLEDICRGKTKSSWAVDLHEWKLEDDSQIPNYICYGGKYFQL